MYNAHLYWQHQHQGGISFLAPSRSWVPVLAPFQVQPEKKRSPVSQPENKHMNGEHDAKVEATVIRLHALSGQI